MGAGWPGIGGPNGASVLANAGAIGWLGQNGPMHSGPDYLIAEFSPAAADGRVKQRWRAFISSIISLVLSLIILGVIVYLRRGEMQGVLPWILLGSVTFVSVLRVVYRFVGWRRARADRERVGQGPALVIGRFGVELEGQRFDWPSVRKLGTRTRRFATPEITVESASGGIAGIPLDHLDALPAALDSAARIYSGGQHGVDLAAVDD